MDITSTDRQPVLIVVRRRVKLGMEKAFEAAMSEFIAFALAFPGNQGIHVVRPDAKNSRDYIVFDRFSDASAREVFKTSPAYQEWMRRLGAFTEGEPAMEELGGVGGWFTLPDRQTGQVPSRTRMALVTFLGVFPLTSTIPPASAVILKGLHPLATGAIATALIVAALTWVVMPMLTQLFRPWLLPAGSSSERGAH